MNAVKFARFCINNSIEPEPLAELIEAYNSLKEYADRYANGETGVKSTLARKRRLVLELANKVGLKPDFGGLYPSFYKGNYIVYLPNLD